MNVGTHPIRVLATGPRIDTRTVAGIQRHLTALVSALAQSGVVSLSVFAVTSSRYDESWLRKGLRLIGRSVAFTREMHACDVVHINSTIDDRSIIRDSVLVALARLRHRPVLFQFHGGSLARLHISRRGALGWWCARMLRSAGVVAFLSRGQGEPLAEAFGLERAAYVSNAVDLPPRTPNGADRTPGDLRVLVLGRLDESKGVGETIAAFERAREDGWVLRIAGDGPLRAVVEHAAAQMVGVEYAGVVGGAEKDALLAWADVFVLASAHDEGMPYAALEAAAASTALVTSTAGALGELNRDGVTGILVPPRDEAAIASALERLAADPELTRSLGAAARDAVSRDYTTRAMATRFEALYRSLADGEGVPSA